MREMIDYHDYLIGTLADPEEAIGYFQASIEEYQKDGDTGALLIALESIAEAQSENKESRLPSLFIERCRSPLTKGVRLGD